MYAALLQDWVTIRSAGSGTITQSEPFWLDTAGFLDCVIFMETREISTSGSSSVYMAFQTSPTKDDNLFIAMNDVSMATGIALSVGVQTWVLLRDTGLCPLCHWLRWQISTTGTSYDATFRIWVALNQPGGVAYLSQVDPSAVNMQFEGSPEWTVSTGQPTTAGASSSLASKIASPTFGPNLQGQQPSAPSAPPYAHLGPPKMPSIHDILTMNRRGPSFGGSWGPSAPAPQPFPGGSNARSVNPFLPPGVTVMKK